MDRSFLLGIARRARGLTQAELAAVSGTSQATLSQYERGVKSPSLKVASRILDAMGYELTLRGHVDWVEHHPTGIVRFWAPSMLWAVEPPTCFATLRIPDQIRNTGMRTWNMRDRDERRGVYVRGLPCAKRLGFLRLATTINSLVSRLVASLLAPQPAGSLVYHFHVSLGPK